MTKFLPAILALFISGCYQVAHNGDIQASMDFCATRSGINHITITMMGDEKVECQNGEWKLLHKRHND